MLSFIIFILAILAIPYMFWYDKNKLTKDKKPYHKHWWTWALIIIFLIGGFNGMTGSSSDNDSADSTSSQSKTHKATPKKQSKAAASTDKDSSDTESPEVKKAVKKEKVDYAIKLLKKVYKDEATITYDSKNDMIKINPTDEEFRQDLIDVINGDQDNENWKETQKGLNSISKVLYNKWNLKNTVVSLTNPDDSSKVIYSSYDGNGQNYLENKNN